MNEKDKLKIFEYKVVWVLAWITTASSATCFESKTATTWADKCLKTYKEKFEA